MDISKNRTGTALYRFFDKDNELIYVGVSMNLPKRLYQHENLSTWIEEVVRIKVEWFQSRQAALAAEFNAIQMEHPKYNQVGVIKDHAERSTNGEKISQRKKQSLAAMEREIVQAVQTLEAAQVYALYTLSAIARTLDLGYNDVQWLIDENKLGHVVLQSRTGLERMRVTGWQFLEFLEYLETHRRIP